MYFLLFSAWLTNNQQCLPCDSRPDDEYPTTVTDRRSEKKSKYVIRYDLWMWTIWGEYPQSRSQYQGGVCFYHYSNGHHLRRRKSNHFARTKQPKHIKNKIKVNAQTQPDVVSNRMKMKDCWTQTHISWTCNWPFFPSSVWIWYAYNDRWSNQKYRGKTE